MHSTPTMILGYLTERRSRPTREQFTFRVPIREHLLHRGDELLDPFILVIRKALNMICQRHGVTRIFVVLLGAAHWASLPCPCVMGCVGITAINATCHVREPLVGCRIKRAVQARATIRETVNVHIELVHETHVTSKCRPSRPKIKWLYSQP